MTGVQTCALPISAGMAMVEVRVKKVENTQPMRLLMGNEGPGVARTVGEKAIASEGVRPAASEPPPKLK